MCDIGRNLFRTMGNDIVHNFGELYITLGNDIVQLWGMILYITLGNDIVHNCCINITLQCTASSSVAVISAGSFKVIP